MKTNKYWFKPKTYGYGYYPITWEGWITTAILLLIVLTSAYINNFFNIQTPPTEENILRFFLDLILIIFSSEAFMRRKTKGTVKWNWGKK